MAAKKKTTAKKTARKSTRAAKRAPAAATPMNRAALIEHVAKQLDESKAGADRAIVAVLDGIQRGLKRNKKVSIVGFGTFVVRKRAARKGRNPRTGEAIRVKASKSVGFKAGKPLKESL